MSNSKNVKNTVVAAVVAGAAGFVAGMLLAPKSGKETRQDIVDGVKETETKIAKSAEQVKEVAVDNYEHIASAVKNLTEAINKLRK